MKIAIASDHVGFDKRLEVSKSLISSGYEVYDLGAQSRDRVDYPDFALTVCEHILRGQVDRGILICGTGIGMSIAANKLIGIRAALAWDVETARLAAQHNDANILCLSGRLLGVQQICNMVAVWLEAAFEGGRHEARLEKIKALERIGRPLV